jgi:hypothetical protein
MAMSKRRTKRNKSLITWVTRSSWRALHLGAGWQPIDLQSADQPVHYVAVHSRIHTRPCGIFTPWALSTSMAQRLLHSSSDSFKISLARICECKENLTTFSREQLLGSEIFCVAPCASSKRRPWTTLLPVHS